MLGIRENGSRIKFATNTFAKLHVYSISRFELISPLFGNVNFVTGSFERVGRTFEILPQPIDSCLGAVESFYLQLTKLKKPLAIR